MQAKELILPLWCEECGCGGPEKARAARKIDELVAAQAAEIERFRQALVTAHHEICAAHGSEEYDPSERRLATVEAELGWDGMTYAHEREEAAWRGEG